MAHLANALIASMLAAAVPAATFAAGTAPADPKAMQRTPTKPNGNGIEVRYRLESTPEAGQPVLVSLAFLPANAGGEATAWFTLGGGLAWAGAAPDVLALSAAATYRQLAVVPQAEGIGYLNVFTRQDGVDSVTAIPVRVGKAVPSLRQPGALKTSPGGDRVISLPVP